MKRLLSPQYMPFLVAAVAVAAIIIWLRPPSSVDAPLREPGADEAPPPSHQGGGAPQLRGLPTMGDGEPSSLPGEWVQFRGPLRDGIVHQTDPLAREWPDDGPTKLWEIEVGEGYASPVVRNGRVYFIDYDREGQQDVIRCVSLDDGRDIWRFSYPVKVKRNHGMSRTMPAVCEQAVITIGPKCHLTAVNAETGELLWAKDMVREYGTTVPQWYAGQCPLIDGDRLIIAPGGDEVLMAALDVSSGDAVWETPNPDGWRMTHSSIVPMDIGDRRTYVYCAKEGVVGVDAADGALLWSTKEWKISIATVASPVVIDEERIFLAGGYNAGSMMLSLTPDGEGFQAKPLFRLEPEVFGAAQQTPIYCRDHIYGIRPDEQMTCLDTDGHVCWTSGPDHKFGLGPFLIAEGLLYAMNDSGRLSLMETTAAGFRLLSEADIFDGHDAWGPMTLVGHRLLLRDFTHIACLDIGAA